MTELTVSTSFQQVPLNSKDDIVAELILIMQHGFKVYSKYDKDGQCQICLDDLLNQYVFEYPCNKNHAFHRNCLLTNMLNYKKFSCPSC